MVAKSKGYNLQKALCIQGTRLLNTKEVVELNLTKDLVALKESDVSIDTQPEEERMQGDQIIETTN